MLNDIENLTILIFARLGLRELSKPPDERTYIHELFGDAYDKAMEVMPESDGFHDMDPSAYLHALYVAVIAELVRQTDGPISGVRETARSMILDYFGPEYVGRTALGLYEDELQRW